MSKKYLIFGATGSIGSNLTDQLYNEKKDCHLIGRNEEELKTWKKRYGLQEQVVGLENHLQ